MKRERERERVLGCGSVVGINVLKFGLLSKPKKGSGHRQWRSQKFYSGGATVEKKF